MTKLTTAKFAPLVAALAVLSTATSASAVKVPQTIAGVDNTNLYSSNGTVREFPNEGTMNYIFDGDFEGKGVRLSESGAYLLVDLSNKITEGSGNSVYISEVSVGHSGNSAYSLLVSEDGEEWTALASSVYTTGKTTYPVAARAKFVKYVFDTAETQSDSLLELEVKGYETSVPHVVSKWDNVKMFNILWGGDTFGGGWGDPARVFNGKFGDYQMLPRSKSGSYFIIDFTPELPNGCYIEKTTVDSTGTKKFTLQYSEDGTTWQDVEGAVNATAPGITDFPGGFLAKQMKYIFIDGGEGSYSDEFLAEIDVWGMDPEDIPCTHPSYTEWAEGVPATCTERPQEERFCTVCGERFTKDSDSLPLGHDYVTTLENLGSYTPDSHFPDNRSFGSGSISCTRCDFHIDFPTAIDLATQRVDNVALTGVKIEGVVRFSDLSVSSTDHPQWGPADFRLIDKKWGLPGPNEWTQWVSDGAENQYIDFEFGTQVNLTMVEISIPNNGHLLQFMNVDDETGIETVLGEHTVVRDESVVGTTTETGTAVDPDTGEEVEVHIEKEVYADYQRLKLPFYENAVKHLRIRISAEVPTNLGWGNVGVCVYEVHPWATVVGASDFPADRTTLLIFR